MTHDPQKTKARTNVMLTKMDQILMLVRATGGYKYRKLIRASDKEVADATEQAYRELTDLLLSYDVAREMLKELPPSGIHSRWEEFEMRRAEAFALLAAPQEPKSNIIPFRCPEPEAAESPGALA